MNKNKLYAAAALLCMSAPALIFADDATLPTIPDTGVDVAGYITQGITDLGVIAAVAAGGYVAFKLVRMGLRWFSTIGQSR